MPIPRSQAGKRGRRGTAGECSWKAGVKFTCSEAGMCGSDRSHQEGSRGTRTSRQTERPTGDHLQTRISQGSEEKGRLVSARLAHQTLGFQVMSLLLIHRIPRPHDQQVSEGIQLCAFPCILCLILTLRWVSEES